MPESRDQVIQPERVLVLSKSMCVRWRMLEAGLQGVKSLDDIMRIDLHYLSRWMAVSARNSTHVVSQLLLSCCTGRQPFCA